MLSQTQLRPYVGIGVLIYNPVGRLLLGKRTNALGANTWAPPGGHLEFGESIEACAIRETFEETGLTISTPHFVGLTNDIYREENQHYVSLFMEVRMKDACEPLIREPQKTIAWEWFEPSHWPAPLFKPLATFLGERS